MRDERWLRLGVRSVVTCVAAACAGAEGSAAAHCRTTTCPLPADWNPGQDCFPGMFVDVKGQSWPDFSTYCAAQHPPAKTLPLWWRNACVSYDVELNSTKWASYAEVVGIVDRAFRAWTETTCADSGDGKVSIAASNLGPATCSAVEYNVDQANQHVILFHDDSWPYDTHTTPGGDISANTLGLTTVTFDADTGEIFDSDTEINATVHLSTSEAVAADAYDLASIITHEMGHFLGMAHSHNVDATMYAMYSPGSTSMRALSPDDMAGLCSIYPPDQTRRVDPTVAPGGSVRADSCDATPRHGFTPLCAQSAKAGCTAAPSGRGNDLFADAAWTAMAALGIATIRRKTASPNVAPRA